MTHHGSMKSSELQQPTCMGHLRRKDITGHQMSVCVGEVADGLVVQYKGDVVYDEHCE